MSTKFIHFWPFLFRCAECAMCRNSRNRQEEHWSTDILLYSPIFSNTMPRNRYQILMKNLHFADNNNQVAGDRLYKIKNIVDPIRLKFKECLYPYKNLCIDENLLLFKGRLFFKQYIPLKRSRFGVKFFVMCDCKSGYVLLDFIIYTGATTQLDRNYGLGVCWRRRCYDAYDAIPKQKPFPVCR